MATILALDDDLTTLGIIVDILTKDGHDVLHATRAMRAVETLLAPDPVDLIVTDLVLPDISGVALIERLRAAAPTAPIIIVCAYFSPESRETRAALAELGAGTILEKPLVPGALLDAVKASLR